ncbi:hypothetical protein CC85DRAFT_90983 [Cutaneotrichosporon oleaginosum]|uniref:BAR domain-containing protein n=1 Tax=Cutaneotrichosporon oleaginosum TaxID=879819 RepID=A0A0J0XY84_9TREE|nr:uncharacterized protein CC85DRAFT_90983 [Cutaneotrichosporon oleaginosum]KLT46010.1 hypothetical protein CC85DRAFT_90983 [Cutaneotrichosporon oleaginosum]
MPDPRRVVRHDSMQSTASIGWPRPPSPSLMAAAKAYRNALLAMSTATAAFASAMEACSRVKGCREANAGMAGGAGLQYLISNHEQLLADTIYRQFEIPLLETLDNYKMMTAERLASYEKALHSQSDKIRRTEAENMKIGRRRKRDLNQFRAALADLQRQVDELDGIKLAYHEEVLDAEEETWETVLSKVAFVIRSQLDFYEKIAGKASDPVLEPLVMSIPDPFDSYGPPKEEGQIFSVLSPLHIDSNPTSPLPSLPRVSNNASAAATPKVTSPVQLGFSSAAPAKAETSEIDVSGERSAWGDFESGALSAHRELSVIDEAASPAKSMVPRRAESEHDDDDDDDDRDLGGSVMEGRKLDVLKKGRGDLDDDGPVNDSGGPDHVSSPPKA